MGGGDLLKVNVIPSQQYALNGVANNITVLFQIVTGQKENAVARPPCDLAIVLDRSGSMSGDKLKNSKIAIKKVLDNLSKEDKFHFIVYDDKVDVIAENANVASKDNLVKLVDGVQARASTDLHAGVKAGFDTLIKHKEPGRVQRIFLFSDGNTNCGIQDHASIFQAVREMNQKGVSVTSFGIGADFDEELMKGISEHGSGNYFFIESAALIEQFVAKGLKGLLALVGTQVILKIRGKNGAILKKVYSHPDLIKGADLGDLKQNNTRSIIAEVEISPSSGSGADILSWELIYVPDGETEKTSLTGGLNMKFTDDDKLVEEKDIEVEIASTIQILGENDIEAVKLIDKGDIKTAIEIKTKEVAQLKELEPRDKSGVITVLREKTEKALAKLNDKTADIRDVRKEIHYQGYQRRRNSLYAICDQTE